MRAQEREEARVLKEIEEERRMFYVAATRARKTLTIYSIEKRNKTVMAPSRFVTEMKTAKVENTVESQTQPANSLTQFNKNDWVFHKTFGLGIILSSDETIVTIAFDEAGVKRLQKTWCIENLQVF